MSCRAAPPTSSAKAEPPPDAGLWRHVQIAVALSLAVPVDSLRAPTRCRSDVAFARQVAMYVAHAVLGMSYSAVGRLCGRDHKTVFHACRVVEQRRDDPAVDRMLHVLSDFCREMTEAWA